VTTNRIAQAAQTVILQALATGPRGVAQIPRGWPVTRTHIRTILRHLIADGLVERTSAFAAARVRLTDRGRRVAESQDIPGG
jgi:DNA-binding HxlR family transcriptional regulator